MSEENKERITKTDSTEVVKKKSTQKLWQSVFSFDPNEVKNTLFNKILIPGINNLISSALKSVIDGIFHTGSGGYSTYNNTPSASYQSYYADRGTVPKTYTRTPNPLEENIWVDDKRKADDIVTQVKMEIVHNGFATVGLLYDRAGLTVPYTMEFWGWTSFPANVVPSKNAKGEDGWIIVTPAAMEIQKR